METKEVTLSELIELYDDDQMSFEEYFCDQMDYEPRCNANSDNEYAQWYQELERKFAKSKFAISPNYDYIRWSGILNSDFRIREVTE